MNKSQNNLHIDVRLGDSYKLIKEIPDNSIDLVIIDPPYQIDNTKAGGKSDLARSIQGMNNEIKEKNLTNGFDFSILEDLVRVMKNINCYVWCNHKQIPQYLEYFVNQLNCNFDILIWNKTNAMPLFNNKYLTDKEYCLYFRKNAYCNPSCYEDAKTVFYMPINAKDKKMYKHPTIKPLKIIETLVKNSSREGDVVLDCFMGSGTTGVACKKLNRSFIGFEIDEEYYQIAKDRINETIMEQIDLFEN